MNLTDIFKDSLKYPISDMTKFSIFGIVMLLSALGSLSFGNAAIDGILVIISFVALIISLGYGIAITRSAIEKSDEIPDLNLETTIVDGLKMVVLSIVYYIIPTIIVIILAFATGLFDYVVEILGYLNQYGPEFANMIPDDLILSMMSSAAITMLVAFILMVIFSFLYYMGVCRLAKYNSLSAGADIPEAARDLKKVGIGRVIGWAVLLVILIFIFNLIGGFIGLIPYVGVLISGFLISTYISFMIYRSVGLLYADI
ncbi:DUF4013 domain-containing protein [uncultured Methanobrevibacter sp.]|uniref:DUF4013 domain-containing protein n=1 Tax=uncultured Methanobrevibacter sp. TaxID=253161 RepID=UPI0026157ADD|nr:DUF4013 domain-containing protein [uncultured Methanobrevibacter sp.]